jgi:hypothetical protein
MATSLSLPVSLKRTPSRPMGPKAIRFVLRILNCARFMSERHASGTSLSTCWGTGAASPGLRRTYDFAAAMLSATQ